MTVPRSEVRSFISAGPARGWLRPQASVIPGFRFAFGLTATYLTIIVLVPIAALILKAADIGLAGYFAIITSPRTLAAFQVTFTTAALATVFNALYGLALAWVLVRYDFPASACSMRWWTCRSPCPPRSPASP